MTKKSQNKNKLAINRELSKQIAYLEKDLRYTLKAVDGKHWQIDNIFKDQATKLRKRLDKLRKVNEIL